ncbi:winged helix-turn-helix domain-containing protein [uncultured Methylophaga sp.]|uniref:winged helix-turn-helix domain-containing protein n=1 Tax=uncultured Methylophaga sp. TaxID=285271 RepID=UPI00260EF38D|nr:winged helix-turn-helix domain-containing protein [uncultured Methylophaga sp.]
MTDPIGPAAGKIWHYLQQNGTASASRIGKDTELDSKVLQRAIGWLAKEEKLSFENKGRNELISLK